MSAIYCRQSDFSSRIIVFFTIHLGLGSAMRARVLIKIIFGLSLVIVLWRLLQVEAFDNALLQFVTAGMIPGTKIILTPNQVYWVMGVFLLVSLIIIFLKQIVRALSFARHKTDTASEDVMPATAEEIAKSLDGPRPDELKKPVTPAGGQGKLGSSLITLGFMWTQIEPYIKAAGKKAYIYSKTACRQAYRYARAGAKWLHANAVIAWQWAEPRMRQLDKKIESRLKSNKDIEAFLHVIDESFGYVRAKLIDVRMRAKRIVEKEPDQ